MSRTGGGFVYEKGKPYIMTGHFGPSTEGWDGEVAHYEDNTGLTIMFATAREAIAPLLPPGFVPTDPAVISVSFSMCRGVNYMAGGGYNLVTKATRVGKGRSVFHQVPWEKAVLSHRIVNTPREPPVVQEIGAVMTRYSVDLLIHKQRHME
jgi:hypothetical protein